MGKWAPPHPSEPQPPGYSPRELSWAHWPWSSTHIKEREMVCYFTKKNRLFHTSRRFHRQLASRARPLATLKRYTDVWGSVMANPGLPSWAMKSQVDLTTPHAPSLHPLLGSCPCRPESPQDLPIGGPGVWGSQGGLNPKARDCGPSNPGPQVLPWQASSTSRGTFTQRLPQSHLAGNRGPSAAPSCSGCPDRATHMPLCSTHSGCGPLLGAKPDSQWAGLTLGEGALLRQQWGGGWGI